jgi:hypothetical protein
MISFPDAMVPRVDMRDVGKGRSEVIRRVFLRYDKIIHHEARVNPPGPDLVRAVEIACKKGVAEVEAELLTDDILQRMVLLDMAERAIVAALKGGK